MRSIKRAALLLPAAGLLIFAGASAAGASTGHARPDATPACGANCQDYSSLALGTGTILNGYVSGDTGRIPVKHVDVNFNAASNSHPNQDWGYSVIGQVSQFCQSANNPAGQLSATSVACVKFSHFPAFQLNWQPFGNQSGLCAGTSGPVTEGQNVKLEACGAYQGTIMVLDTQVAETVNGVTYDAAIDGADTSFSNPYVLTVDAGTSKPVNQLKIDSLNTLTGGVAPDSQEFTAVSGPANS